MRYGLSDERRAFARMSDIGPSFKAIIEGALLAAGGPLRIEQLQALFAEAERPDKQTVRRALDELGEDFNGRGIELVEVASGFRVQVPKALAPWVSRLWQERPGRYSRALLETLALIAYRQPVTRGEIEEVRGVAVSTNIIRTLDERGWVRVVGHREAPGRPAMYGTTREFLDYFSLKSLDELPSLAALSELDSPAVELELELEGSEDSDEPAKAVDDTEEDGSE
jgi:segregation and condensation protein B